MGNRRRGIHDVVLFSAPAKDVAKVNLDAFLMDLHGRWGVDLAYVHLGGDDDLADLEFYDRCVAPFGQGLTTHQLGNGLPSLSWAIYFGPPYVQLFGKERLLSAPVASCSEVSDSLIRLQLTEDIVDWARERGAYRSRLASAIEHIGADAFVAEGRVSAARMPTFEWAGQAGSP
jgi:hypothetical protein